MSASQNALSANGRRDDLARELRALRNRSGLTLAALAERTCYSKSSWERYLNGKALPPDSALKAFAESVGVGPGRLLVLRSLAEEGEGAPEREPDAETAGGTHPAHEPQPTERHAEGDETRTAGSGDLVTRRPEAPEQIRSAFLTAILPTTVPASSGKRRRVTVPAVFTALGLVIGLALGVGLAALLFGTDASGGQPTASGEAEQQRGTAAVGCVGFECRGKDPERFDCHLKAWTAAARRVDGVYIQLRYSPTCQAAWGRIVLADVGDVAIVEGAEGHTARRTVTYGHDVYTAMVDAPYPASARACAELGDGEQVCTEPGGASPAPATTPRQTSAPS